jgi:hypothetical protein
MLVVCSTDASPSPSALDDPHHVAFCGLGDRSGWTPKEGAWGPHALVAIDKFSKWIEVRPITTIKSEEAVKFFTDIIHRFGVPNSIITDNDTQFTGKKFLRFCDDHHIQVDWAVVAHPKQTGRLNAQMV